MTTTIIVIIVLYEIVTAVEGHRMETSFWQLVSVGFPQCHGWSVYAHAHAYTRTHTHPLPLISVRFDWFQKLPLKYFLSELT